MKYDRLIEDLVSAILTITDPYYDEINENIDQLLKKLYRSGKIKIKEDNYLSNGALEIRVEELFQIMGFQIRSGRKNNLEDFLVDPSKEFETQIPLVIEVKSSKGPCLLLDDLRQLDDRVFELSGEEEIRKRRALKDSKNIFYITAGLPPGPDTHPTPHKGVLIFNGPLKVPFADRPKNCVHPNDRDFVEKRFFCIFPFSDIVEISKKISEGNLDKKQIWESIHQCSGLWKLR